MRRLWCLMKAVMWSAGRMAACVLGMVDKRDCVRWWCELAKGEMPMPPSACLRMTRGHVRSGMEVKARRTSTNHTRSRRERLCCEALLLHCVEHHRTIGWATCGDAKGLSCCSNVDCRKNL